MRAIPSMSSNKKNWVIIVIKDVVALADVSLFHTEAAAKWKHVSTRAASDSGLGDLMIRVNWQISGQKEDSSLFWGDSIYF